VLAAAAARCAWEVAVVFRRRGQAAAGAFAALVPLAGSASLALIALRDDAFAWIFLLFLVVEAQDAMAWLFGRLFGRRPLLPSLSPRKTVEGAVAGMLCAVALGASVAVLGLGLAPAPSLALCALLAAAGFAGDVLASLAKRAAGAKDFPPVHALHGGLLDVYDALLFAAMPLAALLSATILP
jgi:phosphatidate cytidylyltransferase